MAKPIPATPTLFDEDALNLLNEIRNGTPDTPERIELIQRADELYERIKPNLTGE